MMIELLIKNYAITLSEKELCELRDALVAGDVYNKTVEKLLTLIENELSPIKSKPQEAKSES